jgi:ubiquitin C-terminal hydrolase
MGFGLANHGGSCWVNATLQAIFRIPQAQERYDNVNSDVSNPIDMALQKIWATHGSGGLQELFESIRTPDMPAGIGMGDSHELLVAMCDKLPWLNQLLRFGFGTKLECKHCDYSNLEKQSVLEFPILSSHRSKTLSDCIQFSVDIFENDSWKCESCKNVGCRQRHLLESVPEILVFHRLEIKKDFTYPSILVLNRNEFALFAVVCFEGNHWWTIGRDLPPGKHWESFDDSRVRKHNSNHFPVATSMRMLFYARINS